MAGRVQVDRCGSRRRGDNRLSLAGTADMATEQEFAHGKETSAGSSRRNPAGRISRSAQADTLRGRGRAERAAHPDRTHRARRKARYGRHRAAAPQGFQDRRCVLDEHAGALRSRNGRRLARAADQENCVLRGGVRATQIARTGYLAAYSLIPDATSKSWFRWQDILPPRMLSATRPSPRRVKTANDIRAVFAVLF